MLAISLQRTYSSVPLKELKHRARAGDLAAEALHRAASYGASLRVLLWALTVVFAAMFFVVVSDATAGWFAVFVSAALLWFGFIWLPAQEATRVGVWLARTLAPLLEKTLQYLAPILERVIGFVKRHRPLHVHTGLYDKTDLQLLFERQRVQADNRIDQATLNIVEHALQFSDKKVEDILIPRRVVRSVAATDTTGPVMMDDLHKSGFSRFPVYEEKQDNIVGVLYLRSLVKSKSAGLVSKTMSKTVCYIHEDQTLIEALQAILKTHQQLFIVVNSFEEYVGIVTIEDIIEAMIGTQIVDEFDQYEDLRAVAAKKAAIEHEAHMKNDGPGEDLTEVVQ